METLLSRIEATIEQYHLLTPGERILVACSGGADSVALFFLLKELAPRLKIKLSLIHFDHALRRGSAKDFYFVRNLARRNGVRFYGGRKKRDQHWGKEFSPEEKAREARYHFFEETVRKTKVPKIALAHHQDDQAETVLMRIVQGTGTRGLQGIRPVMKVGRMTLIRPLIEIQREELRKFLRGRSLPFREDRTNRSERFLRNRIRHRLLPLLEKDFNPKIRELLSRLAETAASETASLDAWVSRHESEFLRPQKNGALSLRRKDFLSLASALQFRLLDRLLRRLDPRSGLDFESWKRMEAGLKRGRLRLSLPRNLDLCMSSKKFLIRKPVTVKVPGT